MEASLTNWTGDYQITAAEARESQRWQVEVNAALLAPSNFLSRPDDFEFTIQLIVYHLGQAIQKAGSDIAAAESVRRIAEELINFLAHLVEWRIKTEIERNKHKLLTKLADFFTQTPGEAMQVAIDAALGLYPSVGGITNEYRELARAVVDFFFFRWKIKEQEQYFSQQLGRVLQRTLEIPLLGERSELIANAFVRSKSNVLPAAVRNNGLQWTLSLLRLDRTPASLQESLRIIVGQLAQSPGSHDMHILFSSPFMSSTLDASELEVLARNLHWKHLGEKVSDQMASVFAGSGCLGLILFVPVWVATRKFTEAVLVCILGSLAALSFPLLRALVSTSALRSRLSDARAQRGVQTKLQLRP